MSIHSTLQIGQTIRNAILFDVKNFPATSMNSDSMIQSVQELFALLEQRHINYVLVGGIALLHYVDGRNTQDIDLLVALSSIEKLPELQITNQDTYFVRANYKSLQIDIFLTSNPLFKQVAQKYSRVNHFLDHDIPIATVEGLLLLKLYTLPSLYRQGNFARVGLYENDIATLIHDYRPEISGLMKILAQHLKASDLSEIQSILKEILGRISRFDKDSSATTTV